MGHYQEKGWNAAVEALWAKSNEMFAAIDEGKELDFDAGEQLRDLCLAYLKADREMWVQVKYDNDAADAIDDYNWGKTGLKEVAQAINKTSLPWCLATLKKYSVDQEIKDLSYARALLIGLVCTA